MSAENVTMGRLDDQIAWYDKKSISSQKWFKSLKVMTIGAAAAIPLLAGFGANAFISGLLGAVIVIIEGLQSLNQYQTNWVSYRSTCEELRHEKYLHLAKAGPYLAAEKPDALLAERVESLISREHSKWVSIREKQPVEQTKDEK